MFAPADGQRGSSGVLPHHTIQRKSGAPGSCHTRFLHLSPPRPVLMSRKRNLTSHFSLITEISWLAAGWRRINCRLALCGRVLPLMGLALASASLSRSKLGQCLQNQHHCTSLCQNTGFRTG